MPKVYVVIRTIGEETFSDCVKSVFERNFAYMVLRDYKPLEKAAKETIGIGMRCAELFDWVMALDADIVLSASVSEIEEYCKRMEKENRFCFTGYVKCSKRGIVDGIHFYRTKYCKRVYDFVKNIDFSYHLGREEYEIVKTAKEKLKLDWVVGDKRTPLGIHYFEVNNPQEK